ncbi:MAG: thioredoxin family protein [bacterium]|nr:thioredoxin family protein [bacterium]
MVHKITDETFAKELANNENVVIKFYADWCGSCRLFAPKFTRLSNTDAYQSIQFLEVNAEENPAARKLANVNNLPYFATFKKGELVQGETTSKEEYLVKMMDQLIA